MKRRTFVAALLPSVLMVASASAHSGALPSVEVWKSPVCGCCKDWVAHLQANGFPVKGNDSGNKEARARLGMPVQKVLLVQRDGSARSYQTYR